MSKLKQEHTELQQKLKAISEKIQSKILELPDNPNIERLGGGAFTMNISQVFASKTHNLSPEYYDFKYQYKKIAEVIERIEPSAVFEKLERICENGKLEYVGNGMHGSTRNHLTFHPDVISYIKELISTL